MNIKKLELKNFKSFGNATQIIKFDDKGKLIFLSGKNGSGKCVSPDTILEIDVDVDIEKLLIEFLKKRRKNQKG